MNPTQNPATWLPGDRLQFCSGDERAIFLGFHPRGPEQFSGKWDTGDNAGKVLHDFLTELFRNLSTEERESAIAPGHNTDRLTFAQVETHLGWRLLALDEVTARNQRFPETQWWDSREWSDTDTWEAGVDETGSRSCTLRTKLTPAALRAARGLPVEAPDRIAELERMIAKKDAALAELREFGETLGEWFPDLCSPAAFPIERARFIARKHKEATTELTETKAKLAEAEKSREQMERARNDARELCRGRTELNSRTIVERDSLRAKLAESERRMAQEHFEKMYALQGRVEKAERERDMARQAIESICCVFRHPPLPEQLPRLVHELRKESDAANTRALEAEAQVERMKADLGSARNLIENAIHVSAPHVFLPEAVERIERALSTPTSPALIEFAEKAWKEAYDRAHASMQMHSFPDQTHAAWLSSPTYAAMQSKEGK